MTNEPPGVTPDDDALRALLDRPLTELTADELMALKAGYAARGIQINNGIPWEVIGPLAGSLSTAVGIYSKTFMETLAKHHAEGLIEAMGTRFRKRGKTVEALVGPDDSSAATIVITSKTPDEARLALLDMDVTAEDVRGKTLRWDDDARAWHADSAEEGQPGT